jgi:hypothetical protein
LAGLDHRDRRLPKEREVIVNGEHSNAPSHPTTDPISAERENLRSKQTRAVMPLVGPLLDAWEGLPNDLRSSIQDESVDLCEAIDAIRDAMEGGDGE